MRMTNGTTYLKFAAAFGLFGTVVAIATSFIGQ
jgi:biopolymer transport protein ExbB/TolQ